MIIHAPSQVLADALEASITLERNLKPTDPTRIALRTLARSVVELVVETLIDDVLPRLDQEPQDGESKAQPAGDDGVLPERGPRQPDDLHQQEA